MNLDFVDMLDGYKAENDELLQKMEDALIEIQENGMDDENINAVFRAAHTIKGSSGMFGIDYIVNFTHKAENLLDKIRNHKIEITPAIIDLLLECKDQMQLLVDFVMSDPSGEPDDEIAKMSQKLIESLQSHLDGGAQESKDVQELVKAEEKQENQVLDLYEINIEFGKDTFQHGFDPHTFISYLKELGEIKELVTLLDNIPSFELIDPTECYMAYKINLYSDKEQSVIENTFDFVKESSKIAVKNLSKKEEIGVVKEEAPKQETKSPKVEVKNKKTVTPVKQSSFIRIEADKIDTLINIIGEMVIANAAVMQKATDLKSSELLESVSTVTRMIEEVRENAMQIRMVPIGDTFNKFKRIVHDTANKLNKTVNLVINGGETELDKTVTEKIADPLVHLIRNSVDHGIEAPSVRREFGKEETGVLELNAYHDAGAIVIEIVDDGKGLDAELLLEKGIEKGLVSEGEELTTKEIFELILHPGFSMAKEISDISGRGVGMDVVKRNITELHGSIEINSEKTKGTKITIRLPLTLAIIDGFLTKVGNTHIIIPLDMLVECIELSKSMKSKMKNNNYINLRGEVLPLLTLSEYFNIEQRDHKVIRNNVIVIQYAEQKIGIIVDELLGELQTVIKPMGKLFKNLKYFSGSTILGTGEVALIMDIPVMIQMMDSKQHKEITA